MQSRYHCKAVQAAVAKYKVVADEAGISLTTLCVAWCAPVQDISFDIYILCFHNTTTSTWTSASFLAEISGSSPRKFIFFFHYLIKYFLDQSIQKIFYFILKTEALTWTLATPSATWEFELS